MSNEEYFIIYNDGSITYIWKSTEQEVLKSLQDGRLQSDEVNGILGTGGDAAREGVLIIKGVLVKPEPVQAYRLVEVSGVEL